MAENNPQNNGNDILVGLQQISLHLKISRPTLMGLIENRVKVLINGKTMLFRKFPPSKIHGKYYTTKKALGEWFDDLSKCEVIDESGIPSEEIEDEQ
jgi:hypothetical protein